MGKINKLFVLLLLAAGVALLSMISRGKQDTDKGLMAKIIPNASADASGGGGGGGEGGGGGCGELCDVGDSGEGGGGGEGAGSACK